MTTAVRVSQELVREAKIYSKIDKRSVTGQIEHWARIGKCAEDNPDLTYGLIKEILIGLVELEQEESSECESALSRGNRTPVHGGRPSPARPHSRGASRTHRH